MSQPIQNTVTTRIRLLHTTLASVQYYLSQYYLHESGESRSGKSLSGESLSGESSIAPTEVLLRFLLRQYPLWAAGHFYLAKELFKERQSNVAYVSIMAARQLGYYTSKLDALEAKIYIQIGQPSRAISLLTGIIAPSKRIKDFDAAEDLVAAYMQIEDFSNAQIILDTIKKYGPIGQALQSAQEFIATKFN